MAIIRTRKKTLWEIREWSGRAYSKQLGRKLRSNARCDAIVKRLTRNAPRELYVAPVIYRA